MGSGMEHRGRLQEVPPLPPDDLEELEESKLVLEAVRDVLEEQRTSAERLRSSARQTFVFVAGLFTVAQTAVLTDFGGAAALGADDLTKLLVIGVAAVVGVGITGLLALYADILQSAPAIAISDIVREVDEAAERDEPASDALTRLYASATKQQQPVIESRRTRVRLVSISAAITVALVVTEIAVALITRIP